MKLLFTTIILALNIAAQVVSDPSITGNCVSGLISFNPARVINNPFNSTIVSPQLYDISIDYSPSNVLLNPEGVQLSIIRSGNSSQGVRLSTVRYVLYGKVSAKLKAPIIPGVVTAFITLSHLRDEIDWEFTGQFPLKAHSNFFYRGIPEYNHEELHTLNNSFDHYQTYTIDWKHDRLTWLINDIPVRTVFKSNSTSPMTPPGERWFPTSPSQIQMSIWGGGDSLDIGTSEWSGGPIVWGNNQRYMASFNSIEIQCYDDEDNRVPSWPFSSENQSITYPPSNRLWSGSELDSVLINGSINRQFGLEAYLPKSHSESLDFSLMQLILVQFLLDVLKCFN